MLESEIRTLRIEPTIPSWPVGWQERQGSQVRFLAQRLLVEWLGACLSVHSGIDFNVDHPFHGLYRVPSTTSDWSDCTLPVAPGGKWTRVAPVRRNADHISGDGPKTPGTDGGDPPTQHFLNLPSVSGDNLSSIVGDEDNYCKVLFLHRPFIDAEHRH